MSQTASKPKRRPIRTDIAALPFRWRKGGRSREGELYRRVVRQLRQHLGRPPSVAEDMILARVAWLTVHLAKIDERALEQGGLSDHARREYLAWSAAQVRMLALLGLAPPPERVPTLAELIARQPPE